MESQSMQGTTLLCWGPLKEHVLCHSAQVHTCRLPDIPTKSEVMVVRTDGMSCSRELVEGERTNLCDCPATDLITELMTSVCSVWLPELCPPEQSTTVASLEAAAEEVQIFGASCPIGNACGVATLTCIASAACLCSRSWAESFWKSSSMSSSFSMMRRA